MTVSLLLFDDFAFNTPHPRNVGLTPPYFHDGSIRRSKMGSTFVIAAAPLHVYTGAGDRVQTVRSIDPAGAEHATELPDRDWRPFGATGRSVRACTVEGTEEVRDCRVVDATRWLRRSTSG